MIAKLTGKIIETIEANFILEVSGVGYLIEPAFSDYIPNQELEVYTFQLLKNDQPVLYGFKNKRDLILFKYLISVSGVGPKSAQTIIKDKGSPDTIAAIISAESKLLKVKGVGKKTCERVIIELKDKFIQSGWGQYLDQPINKDLLLLRNELNNALLDLGYQKYEIERYLEKLDISEDDSLADLIKRALQQLK